MYLCCQCQFAEKRENAIVIISGITDKYRVYGVMERDVPLSFNVTCNGHIFIYECIIFEILIDLNISWSEIYVCMRKQYLTIAKMLL